MGFNGAEYYVVINKFLYAVPLEVKYQQQKLMRPFIIRKKLQETFQYLIFIKCQGNRYFFIVSKMLFDQARTLCLCHVDNEIPSVSNVPMVDKGNVMQSWFNVYINPFLCGVK